MQFRINEILTIWKHKTQPTTIKLIPSRYSYKWTSWPFFAKCNAASDPTWFQFKIKKKSYLKYIRFELFITKSWPLVAKLLCQCDKYWRWFSKIKIVFPLLLRKYMQFRLNSFFFFVSDSKIAKPFKQISIVKSWMKNKTFHSTIDERAHIRPTLYLPIYTCECDCFVCANS